MVLAPLSDSRLRTVHILGLRRHDGVHLHLVPKVIPLFFPWEVVVALVRLLSSRLVLMVLLTSYRLRLRSAKELLSALL
jgi:hypothetical protein